jgi:glycosyltransferase involved in cell wall biosynthesis
MSTDFRVVAIIAAFNEEDIIAESITDLERQGVNTYLLDNGSTDDTVERASRFLGGSLLNIERFPKDRFALREILARKEALAEELQADWFINHDADEFRESPWSHLNLRDAIRAVDQAGYNAIDFELLNFRPTSNGSRQVADVRRALKYYELGDPWDKLQVRCWKKPNVRVDLVSNAGHDVCFPGRRVFPLRFVLRHYPIRSQAHGERKIFRERRPRFDPAEREGGWHVQYDGIEPGHSFLRDPKTLTPYDPDAVRLQLQLRHRGVEELERRIAELDRARNDLAAEPQAQKQEIQRLRRDLQAREAETEQLSNLVRSRDTEVEALRRSLESQDRHLEELREALKARDSETAQLRQSLQSQDGHLAQLRRLLESRDTDVEQLRRSLESQDLHIGQLRRSLESRSADAGQLRRTLAAREEEVAALRGEVESVLAEAERAAEALTEIRRQLEGVAATRSWRWTAPLRSIWRLVFRE